MKPVLLIFLLTLMSITVTFGQVKIGDNPQNIDPSSVLELESTSRVLVITRVSTLEMEAIIPQRGGVVYNTDTECMHYYNGTSWINLCDATSFSLTNEPIENITSTISIVDNGTTINLEVAPNSIRSENIVDGGINGDDIQDNSIGESKLGADSVGADELRDNTVGASEIIDGSITPIDMANTIPNQVLTTDSNGTVNWEDTSNLRGAVADEVSITGSGTAADPLTLTDAITANILSNTTAITAHVSADNDTDNQNEVLTSAALEGNELVLTESGVERRVDLGPLNNTGTDNQTLNLNVNSLEITNGNTVNLAKYLDNTDEQQLTLSGNRISLTDGGFVDLPPGTIDTDEQQLTIAGNRISLTDGGFVDLPAGTVDTDNQAITGGAVVGNELRIDIEDGISGTIDISSLTATGTDSQNLTGATLSPTNILQIDIQNGNSTSVDLSALAGGLSADEQQLTLETGNLLTLTNDATPVDLTPFLDDQNASEVTVVANPVNYTSATPDVEAHLAGIDATLASTGSQNLTSVLTIGNSAGSVQINDVSDPTLPQDAATKKYVDDTVVAAGGGVPTDELITAFTLNTTILTITENAVDFSVDLNPTFVTEAELTTATLINSTAITANDTNILALQDEQVIQNTAIAINTAKNGITAAQETILANISGTNTGDQDITGIVINATAISTNETDILALQDEQAIQNAAIAINTAKNGITAAQETILANTSGTNTGDQDISGIATNTAAITANDTGILNLQDEQAIQNTAIALNTAKTGITAAQETILTNTSGANTGDQDISGIAINTAAIITKEDAVNKSNDATLVGNSTINFPTEQAVKTYVDTQIGNLTIGNNLSNSDLTLDAERTHDLAGFNLILEGTGNVGIGNFNGTGLPTGPADKLDVNGQIRTRSGFAANPGTVGEPSYGFYTNDDSDTGMYRAGNNQIGFSTSGIQALLIDDNQNITIPNGSVTVGAAVVHPDYVFQKYFTNQSNLNPNYLFTSLKEIESFIKTNHHLPGIKSAVQVKKEGIWNLSESNIKNLEKIEELFLHTIEQEKKINALNAENSQLAQKLDSMEQDIIEIKKLLLTKNVKD